MAEEFDEIQEDETTVETQPQEKDPEWIKSLREAKEKEVPALQAQLAEYQRKDALREAKLDNLNEDQVKALVATHDGDFTADEIKKTAEKLGFVSPEPETQGTQEEQGFYDRAAQVAQGGQPVATGDVAKEIANANSKEEVLEILRNRNIPIDNETQIQSPSAAGI